LQTGQKATVTFTIPVDMLNFTNFQNKRMVEPGEFEIMVGASSNDIKLRARVEVVGENRVLDRYWRMESRAEVQLLDMN
jgi:beta-xylosidase